MPSVSCWLLHVSAAVSSAALVSAQSGQVWVISMPPRVGSACYGMVNGTAKKAVR